ncbi:CHAD domain-containing protein [Streptomyces winkii]|uniref:CHAD domain-containing protein n=1 Tax=Streptomyces winkii TaxID=3051178 RepID=UPI0028D1A817|nr:CHAD domain-containing protein [Streptomyces sp. DSM 40971]
MRGQAGGLAGPAGTAAPASGLETADAAEVLSGCLHAWAADFLRGLRTHEESVGSAQSAPAAAEAVRRLRCASRRIGSALLTYRPLVDAAWADELSSELRRLSGTLAREYRCAARQTRLLAALHLLAVEGVGGDRAAALLERQHSLARSRAHSAALEALVSSRFHAVADSVAVLAYEVPLAADAPRGAAGAVLVPLAERARERLVHAVETLPSSGPPSPRAPSGRREGRDVQDGRETRDGREARDGRDGPEARAGHDAQSRQDAAWFEVRILLRHHRYAQEVLHAATAGPPRGAGPGGEERDAGSGPAGPASPAGPSGPSGPAVPPGLPGAEQRLTAASAALDRYRDAVEAAEAAAAAARTPRIAPATAYALGVLHAGQRQEAEAARREFGKLWQQVVSDSREAAPQAL